MNNTLDQFYTNDSVALKYYEILKQKVDINSYDICLEPSAGQGAFYKLLPNEKREGVDLDPKYPGVKQMNFFDYKPKPNKRYLVVGNPPFGRYCSMAKKFFNYAATFADTIAFIIPRTFKRNSVQNALDMNFELIFSEDTGKDCFTPAVSEGLRMLRLLDWLLLKTWASGKYFNERINKYLIFTPMLSNWERRRSTKVSERILVFNLHNFINYISN